MGTLLLPILITVHANPQGTGARRAPAQQPQAQQGQAQQVVQPFAIGDGVEIQAVLDPVLARVTNMKYRSFDLDYPDVKRAQTFLDDLTRFEGANQMPALMSSRSTKRSSKPTRCESVSR